MIKKAVIFFFIAFSSANIESPLSSSYEGNLYYPAKPDDFDHNRENHWAEIYFFYDANCNQSTEKKARVEDYFKTNKSMGKKYAFQKF